MAAKMGQKCITPYLVVYDDDDVVVVNHNHHHSGYGLRVGALVNFMFWLSITHMLRQTGYIFFLHITGIFNWSIIMDLMYFPPKSGKSK